MGLGGALLGDFSSLRLGELVLGQGSRLLVLGGLLLAVGVVLLVVGFEGHGCFGLRRAAGSALVGSAWRRRLSRPLARSNRAETAREAARVGRRMAGDVWRLSRFAHGREEQCALNVCQPVHRPQSSSARPAGALGEGWVKAQVLTKSLRVRGWMGGAYDTQSQSVISPPAHTRTNSAVSMHT